MSSLVSQVRFDLIQAMRNRGVVIWVMIFPILLSTVFMFMFDGYSSDAISNVPVGLVTDNSAESELFAETLDSLSTGDDALLTVSSFATEEDAAAAADAGDICAFIVVQAGENPRMTVPAREAGTTEQAIVQLVLDRYLQITGTINAVAEDSPETFMSPDATQELAKTLSSDDIITEKISVLRTQSSEFTRYYYAMLGFSSLMGAQVSLLLVTSKRANGSPAGARRQIAATSPFLQLVSTLIASWMVVFACLVVALVYIRLVANVSLGGREGLAVVACAACALVSCSIGAFIGSLPRISTDAKDVICTILTMGLSLPAGLFGTPSQSLGDWLSANAPLVQLANPAVQVGETFYRLTFYDSLTPFALSLVTLATISVVLFGAAAFFMRRQRYASL